MTTQPDHDLHPDPDHRHREGELSSTPDAAGRDHAPLGSPTPASLTAARPAPLPGCRCLPAVLVVAGHHQLCPFFQH